MRFQSLFPLAACLAFALPLSAHAGDWPAGAKEQFVSQCENAAKTRVDAKTAKDHCSCSEKAISNKLSTAEIKQVTDSTNGVPAPLEQKMMDAVAGCKSKK